MRFSRYLPLAGLTLATALTADVLILEEIMYERTLEQDRRELLADPALTDCLLTRR